MIFSEEMAHEILREQEAAASMRGHYESVWEQIARRVLPAYVGHFAGHNHTQVIPGTQKIDEMVDSTAALALTRFAAAMESMLTPRNSRWHYLEPSDPYLKKDRDVRLYFEEVNRILFEHRYAPLANFASQKHEDYMMLGAFGSGCMFIDALRSRFEKGLRYRAVHIGQMFFVENHQGIIDKAFRKFPLTARQAVQQFPPETLPPIILQHANTGANSNKEYWFVHRVQPRADFDPGRLDDKGMMFESHYVSVTGKKPLTAGGYFTFPYSISRYVTGPMETYGRSPAMLALPSIKTLNEEKKTVLKAGHRTADPVLLAYDDGVLDNFSMRPGVINPGGVTADGKPLVHALPVGNVGIGKDLMDDEKLVINDHFLVTLFQILVETPQMTATEVIERAREKGALLSPTMGRQQSESLGPLISRELDVLAQQRILPPMPPALLEARGKYTTRYDSPLSRMARAEEAAGLMRVVDWTKEVIAITGDPAPLDHYDWDTIIPELSDIQAVPVRWRNSMQKITAMREERAKQQQTQQMIEAAPAMSNMVKTMMPKQPKAPAA